MAALFCLFGGTRGNEPIAILLPETGEPLKDRGECASDFRGVCKEGCAKNRIEKSTAVMAAPVSLASFIESAFIYVPVSWFMIGIAVFLVAYCPRLTLIVWVLLGYSFFMEYVGSAFKFPAWMLEFNPYHHVPTLGMIDSSYIGIIILTVISVVLVAVGFTGYRNRDMKLA